MCGFRFLDMSSRRVCECMDFETSHYHARVRLVNNLYMLYTITPLRVYICFSSCSICLCNNRSMFDTSYILTDISIIICSIKTRKMFDCFLIKYVIVRVQFFQFLHDLDATTSYCLIYVGQTAPLLPLTGILLIKGPTLAIFMIKTFSKIQPSDWANKIG